MRCAVGFGVVFVGLFFSRPSDARAAFMGGGGTGPGSTQLSPILPVSSEITPLPGGGFLYTFDFPITNNQFPPPGLSFWTGLWFDPPLTSAYQYTITTPGALFASVGLPTGVFSGQVSVIGGGQTQLGSPGATITFPGSGVTTFQIAGINPPVDSANPGAIRSN